MLKRHGHVHLLLGVGYVHLFLFPNLGTFDVVPQNVGTRIKVISQSRIIDNFHVLLQGSNTIKQIHLAQNRTNKKQELLMECLTKVSQGTTLKVDLPSSGIDLGVIENQHSTFKIALLRYRSRCNRESTFYLQDSTTQKPSLRPRSSTKNNIF